MVTGNSKSNFNMRTTELDVQSGRLTHGPRGFVCLAMNSAYMEQDVQSMWGDRWMDIKPLDEIHEPNAMSVCEPMHAMLSDGCFINLNFETKVLRPDCMMSTEEFPCSPAANVKHDCWDNMDYDNFRDNSGIFNSNAFHGWQTSGCFMV